MKPIVSCAATGLPPLSAPVPATWGGTAPRLCSAAAAPAVARVLLEQGANRELRDRFGQRALDYARDAGADVVAKLLQECAP